MKISHLKIRALLIPIQNLEVFLDMMVLLELQSIRLKQSMKLKNEMITERVETS